MQQCISSFSANVVSSSECSSSGSSDEYEDVSVVDDEDNIIQAAFSGRKMAEGVVSIKNGKKRRRVVE